MLPTSIETPEIDATSRMLEVRRRLRQGYYDRPEVRRILSGLILRRLVSPRTKKDPRGPDSP